MHVHVSVVFGCKWDNWSDLLLEAHSLFNQWCSFIYVMSSFIYFPLENVYMYISLSHSYIFIYTQKWFIEWKKLSSCLWFTSYICTWGGPQLMIHAQTKEFKKEETLQLVYFFAITLQLIYFSSFEDIFFYFFLYQYKGLSYWGISRIFVFGKRYFKDLVPQ